MQTSQAAQNNLLQNLHDQEVSQLMKRLENQNKEDLNQLSKKHKDKNELARIKRELQQRLIDNAVCERSKLKTILEKRKCELEARHEEVKLKLEQEKIRELTKFQVDYQRKTSSVEQEYQANAIAFVNRIMMRIDNNSSC